MRILVAINGSSDPQNLLSLCAQVAQHAGEPVTLLAVAEPKNGRSARTVEGLLARASAELQAQNIQARTRIGAGRAADVILHEIEDRAYDLVVLEEGYVGRLATRWHPASSLASVTKRACCSVAIVKGPVGIIRRILLCDSGAHGPADAPPSPVAPRALSVSERFAGRLADLFGGDQEVTILHVMSQISAGPGVRGQQLRADASQLIGEHTIEGELLARDVRLLEGLGVRSRAQVRHGLVVDEILAEAQDGDYDLVVIGAPALEGWRRFLLDDLAAQIVEQVDRPVLVVR